MSRGGRICSAGTDFDSDADFEATKSIFDQDKVNEITETTLKIALEGNLIEDESDLRTRIATMIKQPNIKSCTQNGARCVTG